MTNVNKPKLPSGQVVTWNEEKVSTYYSNLMAFSMTPFDITVIFGEVGQANENEVQGIGKARIILSPEQAMNLHKLVGAAVMRYVEVNGPLRTAGAVDLDVFESALNANSFVPGTSNEG